MSKSFIQNSILVLGSIISQFTFAQTIDHWEAIVQTGDNCQYLIPDQNIGSSWIEAGFDDSSWTTAPSGIGYNDGDDNTIIAEGTLAVYMRFQFDINDINDIERLVLDMDYDDGFVAYLNGSEVARANINDPISWDMELTGDHEAVLYNGGRPESFELTEYLGTNLVNGTNTLAVEVHNHNANSSDFSSNIFLHAGMNTTGMTYDNPPGWFTVPGEPIVYGDYNLPLMIISTNGLEIPKVAPRIVADMGIIYNGEGQMNRESDVQNEYSGKISIKRRGESSSGFPKRSYSIELQNEDGTNNNVSILGLPEENDFALYGPYSDQTLMKNVITYKMFSMTGRYAPRTRYVEVIIDGDYRGVYVLMETIKRDKNRIDIDKLTSEDITPKDISGGYILRRDKKNELENNEWWTSPVEQPYHERMWYQYFDPQRKDLTDDQANYIKDWMEDFDQTMSSDNFNHPQAGYPQFIKIKSFIDMMLVNEISKGIDSYLFSTYFYKENDSDGGKLVAGAPWDYNLAYGNLDYGDDWDAAQTYGWAYTQGSRVYWYERLMEDDIYRNKVYCQWAKYRATIYSDENLNNLIDSCVNVIGDAAIRNFDTFNTLGQYVWPARAPYPTTYAGEVAKLRSWLMDRLAWMDDQWFGSGTCTNEAPTSLELDNNSIMEKQPSGTVIGEFTATDPNPEDNLVFQLIGGKGSDDNDAFTISGNQLLSIQSFDFNEQSTYLIRAAAVDEEYEDKEEKFEISILSDGRTIVTKILETTPAKFGLYPNPSREGMLITEASGKNEYISLDVINMSGIKISSYEGQIQEINKTLSHDSKRLSAGIYLIKINSNEQISSIRFVKL